MVSYAKKTKRRQNAFSEPHQEHIIKLAKELGLPCSIAHAASKNELVSALREHPNNSAEEKSKFN